MQNKIKSFLLVIIIISLFPVQSFAKILIDKKIKKIKKKTRKIEKLKKKGEKSYKKLEETLKKDMNHDDLRRSIKKTNQLRRLIFRIMFLKKLLKTKDIKEIQKHFEQKINKKQINKKRKDIKIILPKLKKALRQNELEMLLLMNAYSQKYKILSLRMYFQSAILRETDFRASQIYLKYAQIYSYFSMHYKKQAKLVKEKLSFEILNELKTQAREKIKQEKEKKLKQKKEELEKRKKEPFIKKIKRFSKKLINKLKNKYKRILRILENNIKKYKPKIKRYEFQYRIMKYILKQRLNKLKRDFKKFFQKKLNLKNIS